MRKIDTAYVILTIICLSALYSIYLNLKAIDKNPFPVLQCICTVLVVFSASRYLTLLVYGDSPTYRQLDGLRYFYFATSIGLTGTMFSAVWYATPLYRERIKYAHWLIAYVPWALFYLFILIKQPTEIVKATGIGYTLSLIPPFSYYLAIAQGGFVLGMCILCLIGIFKYRSIQLRVQLGLLMLAQGMLVLDGIGMLANKLSVIPPFTVTEIFAFLAVYYTLKQPIREAKYIKAAGKKN